VSRYRLCPTPAQEAGLLEHCGHARYVWNLAVEQGQHWTPGRAGAPGFAAQCRQLTEARRVFGWLAAGSIIVQQQALRDFAQAMSHLFAGTHRRPTWRKAGRHEGFRIVAVRPEDVRRVNRRWSEVRIPKVGWVRFRRTRAVPAAKSYRVTRDRAGRWHVAFAVRPDPIDAPGTGEVVGVDRGVVVTAALSTGETLNCPGLSGRERARLRKAERRAARAPKRSAAKAAEYAKVGRFRARETDLRKDWVEKTSTALARRFDVIRFEDLRITNMTASAKGTVEQPGRNVRQKAGLNRAILACGWGMLARRTAHKAPGRVQKVTAAYTSLRCSACGWVDKNSRKSQAEFVCTTCGFTCNADTNASINVAAGQDCTPVPGHPSRAGGTTRRKPAQSVREPQLDASLG